MRRASAERTSGRPRSLQLPHTREILGQLARILVTAGELPEALAGTFASICRRTKPPRALKALASASHLDHAHVISHWYSNPEYLDGEGKPRALAFDAGTPSLKALIARVLPHADPKSVLASLVKLGAVRGSSGRYRPAGYFVSFGQERREAIFWLVTALRGVLHTIDHNVGAPPEFRILARAAINPRYPSRGLPEFHERLRTYAGEFLKNVDGEMQRNEASTSLEPTTELGVVVFAFEDPLMTGQGKANRPARRRRRTRGKRR